MVIIQSGNLETRRCFRKNNANFAQHAFQNFVAMVKSGLTRTSTLTLICPQMNEPGLSLTVLIIFQSDNPTNERG